MDIKEKVAILETKADTNDKAWDEQLKTNRELYGKTNANELENNTMTSQGKILKWILVTVAGGAVAMVFTLIGTVLLHWILVGKPGL